VKTGQYDDGEGGQDTSEVLRDGIGVLEVSEESRLLAR
jgi:nitrogen fixation-related uncharacterized protein